MTDTLEICPFCSSAEIRKTKKLPILFNGRTFLWRRCPSCGLLFLVPELTDKDYSILYSVSYHRKYYFRGDESYSSRVNLLDRYGKKTILDYGCGDGGMLLAFAEKDYQAKGVEYDDSIVKVLRGKFPKIPVLTVPEFWNGSEEEKYDVIHLGDVLEHLNQPLAVIRKLVARLNPGGLIFIEGPLEANPNLSYYWRTGTMAARRAIKREWAVVREPYHVFRSAYHNQLRFFECCGLKTLYYKTLETGYPYIDRLEDVKSPWMFIQWAIARTSIRISSWIPSWGNRFVYIGQSVTGKESAPGP
jgi:SAM-dependent methyltransferase